MKTRSGWTVKSNFEIQDGDDDDVRRPESDVSI